MKIQLFSRRVVMSQAFICERLESRCLHQGEISQSFWPPGTHLEWCLPTERGIDMDIFLLDAGARKDVYANVLLSGATTSFEGRGKYRPIFLPSVTRP